MQITTKTFNEEIIDWKQFQIIPITDEMKKKYPALKKYDELIAPGELMYYKDALNHAKRYRAVLPDRKEGLDVVKFVKDTGYPKYIDAWTREIEEKRPDGYDSIYTSKYDGYGFGTISDNTHWRHHTFFLR